MFTRFVLATLLLNLPAVAQSPANVCPADRPIDDIVANMKKQESKRNKNPIPDITCVWGWCHETTKSRTPPTLPSPAPTAKTPSPSQSTSGEYSSNKIPMDRCNDAMAMALDAAVDVEIGDDYFKHKNYRGALFRYQDALENKPHDVAIQVRSGRASEKLNEIPQAIEYYQAADKIGGTGQWADEAHAALLRLASSAPTKK